MLMEYCLSSTVPAEIVLRSARSFLQRDDPLDLSVGRLNHRYGVLQIRVFQPTVDAPWDESQALLSWLHSDLEETLKERSLIRVEGG